MKKLLDGLNESQRSAVLYNEGPSMIIAGAGSGKTRVLTIKIAYLIDQGMAPWSIMALTFTNKAAREMKERIASVVGAETARRIWMGTFHSIFAKILRANAEHLGFRADFTIYDSADSKNLLKTIIKEMNLDEKGKYKPATVLGQISNAKNNLVTPGMYKVNSELRTYDLQAGRPEMCEIYQRYWDRCKRSNAMDFDDLLLYTNILFRDHPAILERYQQAFQFFLVDEYQDTNRAQHLIVEMLSKVHHKVCVVGDDAQSIYSFRGANIGNILNFNQSIPNTRIFKLEQNYRSTQTIVNAANSLIKKNTEQIEKTIFSNNHVGAKIPVIQTYSDFEEAYSVARKIEQIHLKQRIGFQDFAILYRTNAQSRTLEEALRKTAIPYRIYGGLSFYQRKEIKDIIAYARLCVNPNDEEAFKRIINYPARGIGDTTVKKIAEAAITHQVSYYQVIQDPLAYGLKINSGTANKLAGFRTMMDELGALASKQDAFSAIQEIIRQSGIMKEFMNDLTTENLTRKENIDELLNAIQEFVINRLEEGNQEKLLTHFLGEASLLTDQDTDSESDEPKVTLMTIHASKGLEFKFVFVVGLEEDLFPSGMAKDTPRGLEEERRLFYVAITRAEEQCFLSYAKSRFRHGETNMCSPSRFLREIDEQYLDQGVLNTLEQKTEQAAKTFNQGKRTSTSSKPSSNVNTFSTNPTVGGKKLTSVGSHAPQGEATGDFGNLQTGTRIKHERFGEGIIQKMEGSGDNRKITVQFQIVGEKTLLLKFARFSLI